MNNPTAKDIQYLQMSQASAAIFSTCSKAQFFSLVVDTDGNIVGTGYNGSPPGHIHCVDGGCPRAIEGSPSGGDYDNCVAAHAEANALVRTGTKAKGSTIYVGALPCWGCAKLILTAGIARLVYTEGDRVPVDRERVLELFAKSKIEVVLVDVVPEIGATAVKMPTKATGNTWTVTGLPGPAG